jgi:hypothetical protein
VFSNGAQGESAMIYLWNAASRIGASRGYFTFADLGDIWPMLRNRA